MTNNEPLTWREKIWIRILLLIAKLMIQNNPKLHEETTNLANHIAVDG